MTTCAVCHSTETVNQPVPSSCRDILEDDPAVVAVCESCLGVTPVDGPIDTTWHPSETNSALPNEPSAAVGVALLVSLLDSLALNRRAIVTVVRFLEECGVDPLLQLDRITTTPTLNPHIDVPGRRDQLAQVVESLDT